MTARLIVTVFVAMVVAYTPVDAQTTDARTISIHEPLIELHETNLVRELVVQIPPSDSRPLELKVGTRVEAARVDLTLTNVNIDGVFRGDLSKVLDRLQMRSPATLTSPSTQSPSSTPSRPPKPVTP
jgi:hypothetical protein